MNKHFIKWVLAYLIISIPNYLLAQNKLDLGDFNNSTAKFEGSIDHKAPMVFCYKYSVTQQIYTAEELNNIKNKEITELQFRSHLLPDYNTQEDCNYEIKIYLKEIDYDRFKLNEQNHFEWEQVSEDDLYGNTEFTINFLDLGDETDSVITIKLDTPFNYTGKNLLVMFRHYAPNEFTEEIYNDFYCYPDVVINKPYRTLYYADDKSTPNSAYPKYSTGALKQVSCMLISYKNKTVEVDQQQKQLSLYPTLVTTNFIVKTEEATKHTSLLQIYNTNGQKVYTKKLTEQSCNINIKNLPPGIYYVKVNEKINKIVKQ